MRILFKSKIRLNKKAQKQVFALHLLDSKTISFSSNVQSSG